MRLRPEPDALEFAAAVRELLTDACDSDVLRAAWDSTETDPLRRGRVPGLWKRLADIGVPGLTVPEAYGGAGMDLTAAVPVYVEAGRAALPEPVVETLAGSALLAAAGGDVAAEWLPRIAAGDAVVAIGQGNPALIGAAQWADLLLIDTDDAIYAVERTAAAIHPEPSLDHGIGIGRVTWQAAGQSVLPPVNGWDAFDVACVAAAAELVGLAQAMLDMAVTYARQREQFGKPIGSFQAVKHQLADVYVANAFALPVVYRAAWSVAHHLPSAPRDASHAKLAAGQAAERAARTALQVHAGIGYTYEHDLHMWMKRTWTLAAAWGDATFHRDRVAAAVLTENPPPRVP
ncbi:MAG TPA: acyl-CoA dehydrogenase family protein [Mycobacteriales bacterium]|nr:acyl-CoA dehydrogenase family protein [Mycobacteriales bacterium]